MDGIILINKEKNYTSRDVVNIISKHLNTKKVGHFGTLDPLATGLLIIGVGKYTKFQKVLEDETKEYEVEILLGKSTDTYDITGNVVEEIDNLSINKNQIKKALLSFKGKYFQEVPIYSAVKIKGKKLYEYARNKETVDLPAKEVEVFSISNISFKQNYLSFTCLVSKGFYIRSLVNALSKLINIPMCMNNLKRTKINKFNLSDAYSIKDFLNYNHTFYDISKLFNYKKIELSSLLEKEILNGVKIDNIYQEDKILFTKNNKLLALYVKDEDKLKVLFYF